MSMTLMAASGILVPGGRKDSFIFNFFTPTITTMSMYLRTFFYNKTIKNVRKTDANCTQKYTCLTTLIMIITFPLSSCPSPSPKEKICTCIVQFWIFPINQWIILLAIFFYNKSDLNYTVFLLNTGKCILKKKSSETSTSKVISITIYKYSKTKLL